MEHPEIIQCVARLEQYIIDNGDEFLDELRVINRNYSGKSAKEQLSLITLCHTIRSLFGNESEKRPEEVVGCQF